jgi:hypothetical protein
MELLNLGRSSLIVSLFSLLRIDELSIPVRYITLKTYSEIIENTSESVVVFSDKLFPVLIKLIKLSTLAWSKSKNESTK